MADRPRYFRQQDRTRANSIRDKFIEPAKKRGIDIRAVENTDYGSGVPLSINTAIYIGEHLLAVADVRWRSRRYNEMEISNKDLYNHLARWHMENPSTPAFVIWAFGDTMDVLAWQYNPNEKYSPRPGGRSDRGDERDFEPDMIPIPSDKLERSETIWTRAGLI
jgi:hypothetical protein